MNLPNASERLRNVLRRQHKAIATEALYVYYHLHEPARLAEIHRIM